MATTADSKNGPVIKYDNKLQQIMEFQRTRSGKGPIFVCTRLKDVLTGKVVDKTFNAGVKIEMANVGRCDMMHLYHDSDSHVFTGDKTFDQVSILDARMLEGAGFLFPETTRQVSFHEGNVLFTETPVSVELKVERIDPSLQDGHSTGDTKPATMETGAKIRVPLFTETGDVLKVDTRDGSYVSCASH